MDETLHQLRVASYDAAGRIYACQNSYFKAAMARRYSGELSEYLKAAEAYKDALRDLWLGLLAAAPFFGKEAEMRRTIVAFYQKARLRGAGFWDNRPGFFSDRNIFPGDDEFGTHSRLYR